MTGSQTQDEWVICQKCTGLLQAGDPTSAQQHTAACEGDINTSTCSYFAVEKHMLMELFVNDIPEPLESRVDAATGKELGELTEDSEEEANTPQSPPKAKRRKRNVRDDYVPVGVKDEDCNALSEQEDGKVRRSKRKPKPNKNYDHEWYEGRTGTNKEAGDMNDSVIEDETTETPLQAVMLREVTGTEQASLEKSVLMREPHTFQSEINEAQSAPVEDAPQLESIESLYSTPKVKTESQKKPYAVWKQQLAEEYLHYKEILKKDDGTEEEIYRCPKCVSRTFPPNRVGMFGRHLKTCKPSGSNALKCPEPNCEYVAKDAKRFSEHKRHHLQPYMCEFCSRRFADKRNMIEHRMTHTDERPLACQHCEYRTRNRRLLKEHERKHTGKFLHCKEPGCTFFTPYHGSLMTHIELRHRARNKHRCRQPACTYVTNSKGGLQRHHLTRHTDLKNYQCSLCSYKAVSKFAVISHLRSHTKEKIYFCDKCNYSASYASAFRQHMMTHLGLKTWQCSPCGYNSNTRAKVIRHLINKHPDVEPTNHVVNLGLSLKLDLSQFKRSNGQKYLIEEVNVKDEAAAIEEVSKVSRAAVAEMERRNLLSGVYQDPGTTAAQQQQQATITTRIGEDGQIQIIQGSSIGGHVTQQQQQEVGGAVEMLQQQQEELMTDEGDAGMVEQEMGHIVDVGGEEIVITEQMLNGTQELIVMTEDGNIIVPAGGFGALQGDMQDSMAVVEEEVEAATATIEELQDAGMEVQFVEEMVQEEELETS